MQKNVTTTTKTTAKITAETITETKNKDSHKGKIKDRCKDRQRKIEGIQKLNRKLKNFRYQKSQEISIFPLDSMTIYNIGPRLQGNKGEG